MINGFTVGDDIPSSSLISNEPPAAAEAGPTQNVCGTFTTLNADAPAVGMGQWSFVSNPDGFGVITDINDRQSDFSGTQGVTYVLQWTVSNGVCTSTTDVVAINFNLSSPSIDVQPVVTQTACEGTNVTLSVTASGAGSLSYQWFHGASPVGTDSNVLTLTNVTPASAGNYTVQVTGTCAPPVTSNISALVIDTRPLIGTQPSGATICQSSGTSFSGTATGTGLTYIWQVDTGTGFIDIPSETNPNYTFTSLLSQNNNRYRLKVTGACGIAFTIPARLTVNPQATANAGGDGKTCQGTPFLFTTQSAPLATASNYSSLLWTFTGGSGTLFNATSLTPTYYPTPGETGTVTFTLTAFNLTGCTNATDPMDLVITPAPVVDAGSDAQVCEGTSAFDFSTRSIIASTANGSRMWTHDGNGSFVDATQLSPIYNVSPSDVGNVITFTLTVTSGSPTVCAIVQDQFQLRVNQSAVVVVPASYTTCEPAIINLSGTVDGSGTSGSWSIISGTAAGTLSVSSLTGSGPTVVTATYDSASVDVGNILGFRLTSNDPDGAGPCTAVSADINITIDQAARVSAGSDFEICEYNSVSLNGTVGGSASSVTWTGGGGAAQFVNPNAAVTTYNLTTAEKNATNTSILFTITTNNPAGVCPAASDNVMVIVNDTLNFVTFLNLDAVYQEDAPVETLAGVPAGGTFLGPGIISGTNTFNPDFANLGPNEVTYLYTDPATACLSRWSQTTIVNPITEIEFDVFVSADLPLVQVPEVGGVPQICATIRPGDVLLKGDPDVLDPDASTVSPPVFTITPDTSPSYIFKKLDGQYYLNTKNLPPGDYVITYTYTNEFEAETEFSKQIHVVAAPKAIIDVGNACETSLVTFTHSSVIPDNSTPPATLVGFNWDYGNGVGSTEATPPPYSYPSSGIYDITLEVVTSEGCRHDTLKTIRLGSVPDMKFAWSAFCQGNDTKFTDQTVVTVGAIAQYTWMFGDGYSVTSPYGSMFVNNLVPAGQSNGGRTTGTFANPHHKYDAFSQYDVTLQVETTDGCIASLTRKAFILSYGTPSPTTGYSEDFEAGQGSWFATRSDVDIATDTSWVWGIPAGSQINTLSPGTTNAWWTGANETPAIENSTYYNNEKSAVIGPCVNLSNIKRPMISFDYWSDSELGSDGAVLQYSVDGGQTWANGTIGNDAGAGINWYNGRALTGNPGLQNIGQFGWTGQQGGWKNARYNLDDIPKVSRTEVIFRIAFGSNNDNSANPSVFNGFAFDNVFIGEKKRNVLVEYFTNIGVNPALNTYFDNLYNAQVLLNDSSDFFKIQYHTSLPLFDPINQQNQNDPEARSSFYGITDVPSAIMDGIRGNYFGQNFNGDHLKITPEQLDRRALEDPMFDIKIDTLSATPSSMSLHIEFKYTSTAALSTPVTFQVALVEDSVTVTGLPMQRNILRKFLLGSSGKTVSDSWTLNETMVIDTVVEITAPIGVDNNQLYLVAFAQERRFGSNVVYQSAVYKLGVKSQAVITGIDDDPVLAQVKDMAIYPNPATRYVNFATEASLTRDYQYTIVDQRGITVLSGNLNRDLTTPQPVELSNLADGVYIVMIHQGNRRLIQRKLAVLKR
jgi:hypothetical protein